MPRIPDEPNRGTDHEMPLAVESLPKLRIEVVEQELYSDLQIRTRAAVRTASRRDWMVMEPVGVEDAIEKAKKKGLRPGRVKGTDGIQFTKGRNNRIEVITWEEFRSTLAERELEVFDSNGFMKIMKRRS